MSGVDWPTVAIALGGSLGLAAIATALEAAVAEPSANPDPTRPAVPVLSLQSLREQIATRELHLAAHRQQMPVIPTSKEQQ